MSQSISPETNIKESVQGITGISVSGYRSLYEECSIEVRSLTILAGANSSGKSSIMQPLLLLKQTLEAPYDPGALKIDGPNVRFTSAEQLLSKLSDNKCTDSFTIKISIDDNEYFINTFTKQPNRGFQINKTIYYGDYTKTIINPELTHQELVKILPLRLEEYYEKMESATDERLSWSVIRFRCFLDFKLQVGEEDDLDSSTFSNLASSFEKPIRNLIHVAGLRGNPERTYNTTAVGREFPGSFENYVASIIERWQSTEDKRLADLGNCFKTLGLTWKVDARQVNDVQIELRVSRLPRSGEADDMVSIADVGFGVSQILPVLVALLVAEPGQLVYLEQPEIHLHPRAQVALAEILASAANRGVRVVLETHSDLLMRVIQSLVAEGKISPEKVKLHWFKRRDDGVTEVSSADLDDAGAFGDWPEDFSDVDLATESRYLDAAESRLAERSHVS